MLRLPDARGQADAVLRSSCELRQALLYAINGGRDEMTGMQVIDKGVIEPIQPESDGSLDYEKVKANYEKALEWLSETYVMALNIIHYMHDKYAYESIEMALHDKEVYRTLGCGMSGLSIAADSLSACKYAKVYPIYNKDAKTTPGHEDEYVEGADDDLIVATAPRVSSRCTATMMIAPTRSPSGLSPPSWARSSACRCTAERSRPSPS